MKDQHELTILLRNARNALGFEAVRSLLPAPFRLSIDAHDTGCQIVIYSGTMFADDYVPVWRGSIWYSSSYEFNDRDKILGLHPQAQFCGPIVEAFFAAVESAYLDKQMNRLANDEQTRETAREKQQAAVDALRSALNK